MKSWVHLTCAALLCFAAAHSNAPGRGFGGCHGGGFSGGGYHAGGYGGGGFGGYHAGGFEGGGYHTGGYGGGGFGGYHASGFEGGGYHAGGYGGGGYGGYHAGGYDGYHGGSASRGQLNSFLGMPTDGGMHAAGHAGGYAASPEGFAAGRAGAHGGVYTGPGGTEVAHGGAGAQGVAAGPNGAAAGGAYAHGTAVKGPDGNVYYHGGAAGRGAAVGPNGAVAGEGAVHGSAVQGAGGNTYYHGGAAGRGAAVGPNGAVAGEGAVHGSAIQGAGGNTYYHGGAAGRGYAAGAGGAYYGGGYATAYGTHTWSATACHAQAIGVQGWYGAHSVFTPAWSAASAWAWHPAAYTAAAWASAAWRPCSWPTIGAWFNWSGPPYDYTYGNNITYQDNSVYYGSQPAGTAAQYYQEASDLAEAGSTAQPADDAQWLPLGVFGLVVGQEKTPEMTFQLAVNKEGVIRGNCNTPPSNSTQAVQGAVDKKTQRAAWSVAGDQNTVIDTGLYNLTKDEAPALLHRGPDKTEQVMLVRVKPSGQEGNGQN